MSKELKDSTDIEIQKVFESKSELTLDNFEPIVT